ncbi:DNA-protecting protein DprA, partial [Escherichia coli]|nr:DNA-protecting protein DprA [Escherichia coli]
MGEHGSAEAALDALPGIARAAGVKDYSPCPRDLALREIEAGRKAGARLVAFGSAAYPARLAEISDAPPLIWARGDLSLLMRPQIALVGA